jgi:threonine/homoserine/homoserine lactone efflux protein
MHLLEFGGQVILVSTLGVLSPGPLFFANLIYGTEQGFRSGIKIAYGHMLVELPLIFLLASGLFTFSSIILSGAGFQMIELGGGIAIIGFALSQIIRILKKNVPEKEKNPRFFFNIQNKKGPLLVGSALSALNPFF